MLGNPIFLRDLPSSRLDIVDLLRHKTICSACLRTARLPHGADFYYTRSEEAYYCAYPGCSRGAASGGKSWSTTAGVLNHAKRFGADHEKWWSDGVAAEIALRAGGDRPVRPSKRQKTAAVSAAPPAAPPALVLPAHIAHALAEQLV